MAENVRHFLLRNLSVETNWISRRSWLALPLEALASTLGAQTASPKRNSYFPAAGSWQHKAPTEVGMDAAKLREAVEWAEAHGSTWDFDKDQVRVFGRVLGA